MRAQRTNKKTISTATESVVTEDASEISALPSELTIATLEMQTMDKSWYNALAKEFDKDYFIKVGQDNWENAIDLMSCSSRNFLFKNTRNTLYTPHVGALNPYQRGILSHFSKGRLLLVASCPSRLRQSCYPWSGKVA